MHKLLINHTTFKNSKAWENLNMFKQHTNQTNITNFTLCPNPEKLFDIIKDNILQAKHSIDVCFFWFDYQPLANLLIDAKNRFINVRVLVDQRSLSPLVNKKGQESSEENVPAFLKRNGVPVYIYSSDNHIMHLKFLIVDHHKPSQRMLIQSGNWTYKDIQYNHDYILNLQDNQSTNILTDWFEIILNTCQTSFSCEPKTFNNTRNKKKEKALIKRLVLYLTRYFKARVTTKLFISKKQKNTAQILNTQRKRFSFSAIHNAVAEVFTSHQYDLEQVILNCLRQAKKEIYVYHSIVKWDYLFHCFDSIFSKDVELHLVVGTVDKLGAQKLISLGVDVKILNNPNNKLHYKIILIDKELVVLGTVNLFTRSLNKDVELVYLIKNKAFAKALSETMASHYISA